MSQAQCLVLYTESNKIGLTTSLMELQSLGRKGTEQAKPTHTDVHEDIWFCVYLISSYQQWTVIIHKCSKIYQLFFLVYRFPVV